MRPAVIFLFLVNVQLNSGAALTFLKEPSSTNAVKGSTITFDCQIDVSQPSYHWLKDGSNITKGSVSLSGTTSSLQIDNLEFSDSGNYSCIATDKQSGQRSERTGILTVKGKPSIIHFQAPSSLTTYIGDSAVFHCVVVGDPEPVVNWKNSSSSIITDSGRFQVFSNHTLKINNLQKSDDGGLYSCVAENLYGVTATSATLRVNDPPVPPSFTTRPANRTAVEGGRETFYCSASGIPSPMITWSKVGGIIPADRREEPSPGALRIVNLKPEDDGIYVCTAQNILGNITAQAFLHIQGYPRITTAPSDQVVTENSSVLFACIIEGSPTPHVEWTTPNGTKFTILSLPSGTIRVLSNNSLYITMVTETDAGKYTCDAVNGIGVLTESATLTVLTPPRFSMPMMNKTQNINSHLSVECGAHATPIPAYQWIFNGSVITRQRSLNLSSLRLADQGFYMCEANNSLGSASGRFFLQIQVPPMFTKSPVNQTIAKGKTASFPCSVTGDPAPSVKWYKSQDTIVSDVHFSILQNGTLVINSVTEQDSGWFTCRATNEAGTEEKKAYLLVADLPVFTVVPTDVTVDEGASVTLSCRARGPDTPRIKWLIEDSGGVEADIVPSADVLLDPSGDLKYANVKSKNRGLHICKACNTAGCKSAKAFLDVLFAPRFLVPPNDVYVLKGTKAVLECKPESSPPATITWERNGANLPGTGTQYTVDNVQTEDEGPYTCKARNSKGSTQDTVKLSIGTKAVIIDFKQTPSQNNKVFMQCIVGGAPLPEVTWYLQNTKLPNKQTFPDYDVNANKQLLIPQASLVNNSFLCNCTNPVNSVARFARIPKAPSQASVTTIMETSLQVSWSQSDPLDLILQYTVQVKSAKGDWEQVNDTIKGSSVLVTSLNSFTAYSFRVNAKNGLGSSPYSQPSQNVTTLEGAPSPPKELKLTAINASVILMSWTRPDVLNGYLSTILYRINYAPLSGNTSKDSFIQHSFSGSPQNFTLQGLAADTVYSVKVFAGRRRNDGVERWSEEISKTEKTWQLVPLTPPVDLTVQSNGAYQIMVKWKVPPYSITGYHIWHKEYDSAAAYEKVVIPQMSDTVYLIKDLEPDKKYEVKARMYSNAGIGPFSELHFVTTGVDAFALRSEQSGGTQSSGLIVAIVCLVLGVLLLLVIIAFVFFKRRQSKRSRQSFHIDNIDSYEDPSLKYVVQRRTESTSRSRASTGGDSEGSVEGEYNFAAEDSDIDERMFAGDRNSSSSFQEPSLRYLDPARLNHDVPSSIEYSVDDVIRLENYKPRGSPIATRKNGEATFYADIGFIHDSNRTDDDVRGSAGVTNSGLSPEDVLGNDEPPNWVPPPPPVNKNEPQVHSNDRRTSPNNLIGGLGETTKNGPLVDGLNSSEDSSEDEDVAPEKQMEPPRYSQVQDKTEKGSVEGSKNGPHSEDTSDDDDAMDWPPPPPPPPQRLSYQPDESDWERPEINALPGKRNRVASWARDDAEDATNF